MITCGDLLRAAKERETGTAWGNYPSEQLEKSLQKMAEAETKYVGVELRAMNSKLLKEMLDSVADHDIRIDYQWAVYFFLKKGNYDMDDVYMQRISKLKNMFHDRPIVCIHQIDEELRSTKNIHLISQYVQMMYSKYFTEDGQRTKIGIDENRVGWYHAVLLRARLLLHDADADEQIGKLLRLCGETMGKIAAQLSPAIEWVPKEDPQDYMPFCTQVPDRENVMKRNRDEHEEGSDLSPQKREKNLLEVIHAKLLATMVVSAPAREMKFILENMIKLMKTLQNNSVGCIDIVYTADKAQVYREFLEFSLEQKGFKVDYKFRDQNKEVKDLLTVLRFDYKGIDLDRAVFFLTQDKGEDFLTLRMKRLYLSRTDVKTRQIDPMCVQLDAILGKEQKAVQD